MTSISTQAYAFLITVLTGGAVGMIFDFYRVTRSALRPGSAVTLVTDLVFWLFVTPGVFLFLVFANWGELRLYVLLGTGLGLFVYYQLLSTAFLRLFLALKRSLGRLVAGVAYALWAIVTLPLRVWQELAFVLGMGRRKWGKAALFTSRRSNPGRWHLPMGLRLARLLRR